MLFASSLRKRKEEQTILGMFLQQAERSKHSLGAQTLQRNSFLSLTQHLVTLIQTMGKAVGQLVIRPIPHAPPEILSKKFRVLRFPASDEIKIKTNILDFLAFSMDPLFLETSFEVC